MSPKLKKNINTNNTVNCNEEDEDFFNNSMVCPNFSEKKRKNALQIPHINVNKRNPHMIKATLSYLGIFLE